MKVKLMGYEGINFVDQKTGEVVKGVKLHVVSEYVENDNRMTGQRCAAIFTRIAVPALNPGKQYDLIYEQPLGSNKSRLVEVKPL